MNELVLFTDDQEKEFPEIVESYTPFARTIASQLEIAKRAVELHNQDKYDKNVWKEARQIRLAIRRERLALDKERKSLKEMAKRYTDAVDVPARELRKVCEAQEEALQKIENFEEEERVRQEIALENDRKDQIEKLGVDPSGYPNLAKYDDDAFDMLLFGIEAKIEKDRKEAEEIAKAEAEAEAQRQKELAEAKAKAEKERELNQLRHQRQQLLNTVRSGYEGDLAELSKEAFDLMFAESRELFEQEEAEKAELARIKADQEAQVKAEKAKAEKEAKARLDKEYQSQKAMIKSNLGEIGNCIDRVSIKPEYLTNPQALKEYNEIMELLEKAYNYYGL